MKIAIVYKHTGRIVGTYDDVKPSPERFGGPWADTNVYSHIEIPSELEQEPLENLEPGEGEKVIGTQMVQVAEEPVYDSNKKPVKGLLGATVTLPIYEEQNIIEIVPMMRRKS